MKLVPLKTDISDWVANTICRKIIAFKPTKDKPFVLGLPTGSTPIGTYKRLIEMVNKGELSFEHVVTFNMDEYIGLPPEHEQSYHYFMKSHFFDHIDIKKENIHIPNGQARDLGRECQAYEEKIKRYNKINLFLGGVGSDGHIAFNEPFSPFYSRTRVVVLTEETLIANSRFFNNDVGQVPKRAITVGIGTLLEAEEIIIMACGFNKAMAVAKAIEGSVTHQWTISGMQLHPKCTLVCDEAATSELKVKTVKYFQNIEEQVKNKTFT
jgi:glucosamine-6-phosphate deaminase